jgi:hypothetical protein
MRKCPRRILSIVAAVFGAFLVCGLSLRNRIASLIATRMMAGQGLSCDPVQVHVPFAMPPSPIELAPMRCESSAGPLQSIHFHAPTYVDLIGLDIGLIHCASVTISLRARPHRDVELNTLGDITTVVGLNEPAIELLFDAAQMSARKTPSFLASSATVLRASQPIASINDMRVTQTHTGISISAPRMRVNQVSALGDASLRMSASPDHAFTDLHFHSNVHVTITAEHLQARRPDVRFEIARGESDSRIR